MTSTKNTAATGEIDLSDILANDDDVVMWRLLTGCYGKSNNKTNEEIKAIINKEAMKSLERELNEILNY